MSRETDIFSLYPETIIAASGTTLVFQPLPGQLAVTIKYGSGGTLYFAGASSSFGTSVFGTSCLYPLGTTEIFNFNCAGNFSVSIAGTTTIFYVVRARSAGFTQS